MNQSKIGDRKGQTFSNSKTNCTTEEAIKHILEDRDSDNSSFFSCFFISLAAILIFWQHLFVAMVTI